VRDDKKSIEELRPSGFLVIE